MTKEDLQQIAELLSAQKQEIAEMVDSKLEPLKDDIRYTRMLIEKQEHNVQLIAEQYSDISAKLERVREIDELRDRVRTLETVVRNHTVSIKELRKAE